MKTKIRYEILLQIAKYLREQELDNRTIIKKDVLLQNFRLTNGKMVITVEFRCLYYRAKMFVILVITLSPPWTMMVHSSSH